VTRPRRRALPWTRKLLYSLICTVAFLALAEGWTTLMWGDVHRTYWVAETAGSTPVVQFDPVLGYRLSTEGVRFGYVGTRGRVESWGTMRGNDQGFPDADDWGPRRTSPDRKRIAVFGDSFTAAQFVPSAWPEVTEDLLAEAGADVELLNLAVDGGGLANWWSVVTRLLDPQGYELDGVVFVVTGDDLFRGFTYGHGDGQGGARYGRVEWGRSARSFESFGEARASTETDWIYGTITPDQFDVLANGDILYALDESSRDLFLRRTIREALPRLRTDLRPQGRCQECPHVYLRDDEEHDAIRLRMIRDLADYLQRHGLPAMVVSAPLLPEAQECMPLEGALHAFARGLDAELVHGGCAFQGTSRLRLRRYYLPGDGHWNQAGSDRFAAFMADQIASWP